MKKDETPKVQLFEASGEINFPGSFLKHYHTHIYCHSGTMSFTFKGRTLKGTAGEFVFWYAHSAVSNLHFSKNFTATVLLVEEEFLNSNLPDLSWSIDVLVHTRDHPVLHFNEKKNKQKVLSNFRLLYEKYLEKDHTFFEEATNTQMRLFTLEMWHVFAAEFERNKRTLESGSIYEQFIHLVQQNCLTEREVQFYADKLHITPKHLNFVCKQNTDITASEWIHRFVRERLIILLENQNLNIAEISNVMEFSSRSFFTRYVKKLLGFTPSEFRRRME
ncbi:helix-turn-helix domain-containing protein [Flavobacteriaceae bacterium SZ-1-7]|uniref:helix-turn-helix domain-containing protein n=1 Tax=Tamlana sedimenti TaxID=3134126 RepID=UPI003125315E